jgi:hypothetical protein
MPFGGSVLARPPIILGPLYRLNWPMVARMKNAGFGDNARLWTASVLKEAWCERRCSSSLVEHLPSFRSSAV